ncbi:glycoside hydrolase family 28 protein [Rhizobium sp.]|uniref:glycoside hydrolase family 28 protein n=1 Tax=Rhizobium sp. TaxID=391 RepID=UPI000E9B2CD1|nr:polygalacturonase [Rhizobium sp.]
MPRIFSGSTRNASCLALTLSVVLPVASWAADQPIATQWGFVAEPETPATVCATLNATLQSANGSLDAVDADGKQTHPDQERLQAAINACQSGAVKLVVGDGGKDAFLSGPLSLKSGVTLWIDKGVTLFASRNPKDFDSGEGDCGTANDSSKKTCKPLIEAKDTQNSGIVGEGRIDGRGGSLLLSGENAGKRSWWDVAWQSKQGLKQHAFRLLQINGGQNFTLHNITLMNSPNFHVVTDGVEGVVAWGIKILTPSAVYTRPGYACPQGSTPDKVTPATCFTPDTVKNTDGFDPGQSSKVLLAYSYISTGDDHVAIKAGGKAPSKQMTFAHNHFYYGHGMSIGSETNSGVEDISVLDLVMDGYDSPNGNGLRIKSDPSRGGKVTNVLFGDVCMRNTRYPMVFDTHYSDATGNLLPDFSGITVRNLHYTGSKTYGGGFVVMRGIQQEGHYMPLGLILDTVQFDGDQPVILGSTDVSGKEKPSNVNLTLGLGPVSFADKLAADVKSRLKVVNLMDGEPVETLDCTSAFVPFSSVVEGAPI